MEWTADLAYVVGLITTDGSLSVDGRHISIVSKDKEQIETFAKILHLNNKISITNSSYNPNGSYYRLQFGNIRLYRFLLSIGLMPNKTKILSSLSIPNQYFIDFLRGHLDGDGCTYSYWDNRWKNSFMLYTQSLSASEEHVLWIKKRISELYKLKGNISKKNGCFYLYYGKNSSISLLKIIYYSKTIPCLRRKRYKVEEALNIIKIIDAGMLKLVYRHD